MSTGLRHHGFVIRDDVDVVALVQRRDAIRRAINEADPDGWPVRPTEDDYRRHAQWISDTYGVSWLSEVQKELLAV